MALELVGCFSIGLYSKLKPQPHFLTSNKLSAEDMAQQKALYLETPKDGEWIVRLRDVPETGPRQVLIQVHAASPNPVNYFIWKQAPKIPGVPQTYPMILGFDASGVVEEVGQGVTEFKKGDRV